jgi:hypothetical protein
MDISPVLEKFVGSGNFRIKKKRSLQGFTHLISVRGTYEGKGQGERFNTLNATDKIRPGYYIPPLIVTANLETAAVTALEFQKVVTLQKLIVKLYERQACLHAFSI